MIYKRFNVCPRCNNRTFLKRWDCGECTFRLNYSQATACAYEYEFETATWKVRVSLAPYNTTWVFSKERMMRTIMYAAYMSTSFDVGPKYTHHFNIILSPTAQDEDIDKLLVLM